MRQKAKIEGMLIQGAPHHLGIKVVGSGARDLHDAQPGRAVVSPICLGQCPVGLR